MKTRFLSAMAILALVFATSCEKGDEINDNVKSFSATDSAIENKLDASSNDVDLIAEDQVAMQESAFASSGTTAKPSQQAKSILPPCATVTTTVENGICTKIVDFGNEGCTLKNGNVLKGKVISTFSNDKDAQTRTVTITLVDFYHNDAHVEGTKTIIKTLGTSDLLEGIHPIANVTFNLKLTNKDGQVYTREGARKRETVAGFETPFDCSDNTYLITGNHTSTFHDGSSVAATIKTPLKHVSTCDMPFPVSGVIEFVKSTRTATLDFGNDACDNLATITSEGVSKEITLQR